MRKHLEKWGATLLAVVLLCAITATPALADAAWESYWALAYSVDYQVYVKSADGMGLNVRGGPGADYGTVRNQPIPDGTLIHIWQECPSEYGNMWGYTDYDDTVGWVYLPETSTDQPILASDVDYYVYIVSADGGNLNIRGGPGTDYNTTYSLGVPNYTHMHITKEATSEYGNRWGYTSYGKHSGWIYLEETSSQLPVQSMGEPVEYQAVAGDGGTLFYGPGPDYEALEAIDPGTELAVSRVYQGWGLVSYHGVTGWCDTGKLTTKTTAAAPVAPPAAAPTEAPATAAPAPTPQATAEPAPTEEEPTPTPEEEEPAVRPPAPAGVDSVFTLAVVIIIIAIIALTASVTMIILNRKKK